MPTLDWKSLEPAKRKVLRSRVVELTREYLPLTPVSLVALAAAAKESALIDGVPYSTAGSGTIRALVLLCPMRMSYVVSRDYDIVRLQKKLIDEAADKEATEQAAKDALARVADIRSAGLRSGETRPTNRWGGGVDRDRLALSTGDGLLPIIHIPVALRSQLYMMLV
jgi:hypothetical protein